jgi:DNA-directed RNA polymerase subunit RPC12/RpoP
VRNLMDGHIDNMDNPEHKIICPYCDYQKPMRLDRLPTRPVAATCPKCSSRFMFKPVNKAEKNNADIDDKHSLKKTKYRSDYSLISDEFFSFYSKIISEHKNSLKVITLLFIGYGMMYFVITGAFFLRGTLGQWQAGKIINYIPVTCSYIMFFPVIIMHSWKFIEPNSGRMIDQLFRYSSTFIIVAISYVVFLYITSYFFSGNEIPLALMIPVVLSSLIPSLLHATIDSL